MNRTLRIALLNSILLILIGMWISDHLQRSRSTGGPVAQTEKPSLPTTRPAVAGVWTGFAERWKAGMYLGGADVFFETDGRFVPLEIDGMLITVSGILVERHDLPIYDGSLGNVPVQSMAGPPGVNPYDARRRMVIEHATWKPSTLATTLPANTWIGVTSRDKAGAYLDHVGYYVDLRGNWPDLSPKLVRVTGTPVVRHDLPVFIATTGPGLSQAGIPRPPGTDLYKASERTVIENPKWEEIPQGIP